MKISTRISLMAIGLLLCTIVIEAQELRVGVKYETKLPAKLEFCSKIELRKVLVPQNLYYSIFQIGLKHEIVKNLYLGGTARYSIIPAGKNEDLFESFEAKRRLTAELVYKQPRFDGGLRLSYRLRYQNSATQNGDSKDYLRSRLQADYKLIKELRPYLALEPYFNLDENGIKKCRLYLGSKIDVIRVGMEVNYILEINFAKKNTWTSHMIGLVFEL